MLYTRKGDGGTSKLFDTVRDVRLPKSSPVFDGLGNLDELNCVLGYVKILCTKSKYFILVRNESTPYENILENIQHHLFSIQGELAGATVAIHKQQIDYLESVISAAEALLPPIKSFILPGGSEAGAYLDIARTIARRTERSIIKIKDTGESEVTVEMIAYLNRLSSALYALARLANYHDGYQECAPNYNY